MINSRFHHFSATSSGSYRRIFTIMRHTFSRSYSVILPSSLTRYNSMALVFSTHLPESVCGTVFIQTHLEVFLVSRELLASGLGPRHHASALMISGICLRNQPTRLNQHNHRLDQLSFSTTPSLKRLYKGTGILTCFPSATPFGLALGAD